MYTLTSRFIETPTKKIAKVEHDYTTLKDADEASVLACFWSSMDEIKDASVRVELKVYQDEATKINKDEIESILKEGGAQEVEVKIIRVPRETVRSAEVTKAQGLPEKVTILAKTRGEEVPEGVLAKAQDLEAMPAEQILERVGA